MPKLRLVAFVSVSFALVAAGSVAACSDDTDTTVTDSGTPDVITPIDGSKADTSTADTGVDAADAISPDAGLTLANIADVVSEHMCSSLARCCYGTANPADGSIDGGGSFNRADCENLYATLGFENSSVGHAAFTSGNVTLDQAKGNDCIAKIDALVCSINGAALQDIRTSCFAAVTGTLTGGHACAQSVECADGYFCAPTDPTVGLAGTCTALKTAGQSCDLFYEGSTDKEGTDSITSEQACSYRGSGTPALHCDSLDPDDSSNYSDPSTWTCAAAVANGESCNSTVWCADGICDPATFTCLAMADYFSQQYSCNQEVISP